MSRRLKQAAVVLVAGLGAAQLVRPGVANPAIVPGRPIQARVATASGLGAVLDRACGDCHSNATRWPWYTRVAPLSWAMAHGVKAGRNAVNFSEWSAYGPEQQRTLLAAACDDVSAGRMPGPWTLLHPEATLSAADVETICAASRQLENISAERFGARRMR